MNAKFASPAGRGAPIPRVQFLGTAESQLLGRGADLSTLYREFTQALTEVWPNTPLVGHNVVGSPWLVLAMRVCLYDWFGQAAEMELAFCGPSPRLPPGQPDCGCRERGVALIGIRTGPNY
jgi:hypothetical protein